MNIKKKINPKELQKSYIDRIENELHKEGLVLMDNDNYLNINADYLGMPSNITELSSRTLGEMLNAYTQQKVYYRTLLGRAELLVEECKRAYFNATEDGYKKLSYDKISETAKERILNSNDSVKPYYEKYMDALHKQNIVKLSIDSIEDTIFLLSREVTRRNADFNEDSRNHNVSRR